MSDSFSVVLTGAGRRLHASVGDTAVSQQGFTIPVTVCGKKIVAGYIAPSDVITCPVCLRKLARVAS